MVKLNKIVKKIEKGIRKKKFKKRRLLKEQPRATLDLREKEVKPVKQHGFKATEIGSHNPLFR